MCSANPAGLIWPSSNRKQRITVSSFSFFLLLLLPLCTRAQDLPECAIPHTDDSIAVDGHLDEPAWAATPLIDQFSFPWWTAGDKDRTEARLLWDEDYLYVGFTAFDPHISALLTTRDSAVSRDDCVEVFIAPDTSDVQNYFNFEFNALGTILDRSPAMKRSSDWNAAGVQVAVAIVGSLNNEADTDSLWTTEIAIPFAAFAGYARNLPPRPGDIWRLNLYRTGGKINLQYITWSDTQTNKPQFHAPTRFGFARFLGPSTE